MCQISDSTQTRGMAANDQWVDWSMLRSLHMCCECVWRSKTQGGDPRLRTEQLGPPHIPAASAAQHLCYCLTLEEWDVSEKSEVPEHVCLNRMQLHFVCTCVCVKVRRSEKKKAHCLKWGVALTLETKYCVCIWCLHDCVYWGLSWLCCLYNPSVTFITVITLWLPCCELPGAVYVCAVYKNSLRKTFLNKAVLWRWSNPRRRCIIHTWNITVLEDTGAEGNPWQEIRCHLTLTLLIYDFSIIWRLTNNCYTNYSWG